MALAADTATCDGVVSGTAVNTFDGSILGPLTVDSRTLTTNYNVADNSIGAQQLWLRGGFEWALNNDITTNNQAVAFNGPVTLGGAGRTVSAGSGRYSARRMA